MAGGRHRRRSGLRAYLALLLVTTAAGAAVLYFVRTPAGRTAVPPPAAVHHAALRFRPGPSASPSPSPSARSYVVRPGDTLTSIAQAQLGSAADWQLILSANRHALDSHGGLIYPGEVLAIPILHQ